MPLLSQCEPFPLTDKELDTLWQSAREHTAFPDEDIAMQCVSAIEIQRLNKEYRGKDAPTNILTFSYAEDGDHDLALCMEVATKEALERDIALRDYVALLVVHGFLHVCNVDHEKSLEESQKMREMEKEILLSSGFVPKALSDVY